MKRALTVGFLNEMVEAGFVDDGHLPRTTDGVGNADGILFPVSLRPAEVSPAGKASCEPRYRVFRHR